MNIGNLFLP